MNVGCSKIWVFRHGACLCLLLLIKHWHVSQKVVLRAMRGVRLGFAFHPKKGLSLRPDILTTSQKWQSGYSLHQIFTLPLRNLKFRAQTAARFNLHFICWDHENVTALGWSVAPGKTEEPALLRLTSVGQYLFYSHLILPTVRSFRLVAGWLFRALKRTLLRVQPS